MTDFRINNITLLGLLKNLLVNPFGTKPPILLSDLKGVNWKGGISLTIFKMLFNLQILISLTMYSFTLGLLVWTPLRMFLSLGALSLLWKLPLLETISLFIENYFIKIINSIYNGFFPTRGWFGRRIENVLVTPSPGAEKVHLDDLTKALSSLKDLPKMERFTQFQSNLKWTFDNVLTQPLKSNYDLGSISMILIFVGIILGGFWVYSNHYDWIPTSWSYISPVLQTIGGGLKKFATHLYNGGINIWYYITHPTDVTNYFRGLDLNSISGGIEDGTTTIITSANDNPLLPTGIPAPTYAEATRQGASANLNLPV